MKTDEGIHLWWRRRWWLSLKKNRIIRVVDVAAHFLGDSSYNRKRHVSSVVPHTLGWKAMISTRWVIGFFVRPITRSLTPHTCICVLRTACFTRALRCAHSVRSFAETYSPPELVGKRSMSNVYEFKCVHFIHFEPFVTSGAVVCVIFYWRWLSSIASSSLSEVVSSPKAGNWGIFASWFISHPIKPTSPQFSSRSLRQIRFKYVLSLLCIRRRVSWRWQKKSHCHDFSRQIYTMVVCFVYFPFDHLQTQ